MSNTLITVNNNKIRTIIKEIIYRSIVNMINMDENEVLVDKDGLIIQDKLDTIVNLVVDNNIVELMNSYKANKGEEIQGKITYILNSIFSAIDLEAVTIDEINGKIPTITNKLVSTISSRMYNELGLYKNVYLPSMRIVSARAKALMSELQHIDTDTLFNIEYAEEHYITEVMLNRGYGNNILGGISDMEVLKNIFLKPLNKVDVYSTIKNTEYADLGMLIHELDTNGELGNIVEHIDEIIKNEYATIMDLIKHISNVGIEDTLTLTVFIIFLRNYIKSDGALIKNGLITVLERANNKLTNLINDLDKFISKDVLVYKSVKQDDTYTLYVIKDNFSKLFKDNDDIHISDIYGFSIDALNKSAMNVNKLCTINNLLENRNKYNELYNKYLNILTSTNRLNNIKDIRNIYSIAVRDVNTNIYNNSNVDSKNDIMNVTLKIVNGLSLDTLLDPKKTSEIIFKVISKDVNNFGLFVDELNRAKKLIGDDVDMSTSIVYASTCILSKYFVSMLKVI